MNQELRPTLLACIALAKAENGRAEEALGILEEVVSAGETADGAYLSANVHYLAGRVLLACRRPQSAVDQLRMAERAWKEEGLALRLLETRLHLFAAARRAGADALAVMVQRSLKASFSRRRLPERLERLRHRIELDHHLDFQG